MNTPSKVQDTCLNSPPKPQVWTEQIRTTWLFQSIKISTLRGSTPTGERICNPLKIRSGFLTLKVHMGFSYSLGLSPWNLWTTPWSFVRSKLCKRGIRKEITLQNSCFLKTSQFPQNHLKYLSPMNISKSLFNWCSSKSKKTFKETGLGVTFYHRPLKWQIKWGLFWSTGLLRSTENGS